MDAVRLFHFAAHWGLILIEAAAVLWIVALALALLGWAAWAARRLFLHTAWTGSPARPDRHASLRAPSRGPGRPTRTRVRNTVRR